MKTLCISKRFNTGTYNNYKYRYSLRMSFLLTEIKVYKYYFSIIETSISTYNNVVMCGAMDVRQERD